MQRIIKHKIKREMPETSSTHLKSKEEHDLAYYIHDRVELMHQVFSVIKPKALKAMAPECVQHISIDDLQELCTEELLGISSKRLCAILDGAEPPSDTESSGSEQMETISLDSISSDDEILSQPSKNKKHKHKKHKSRAKHKRKNSTSNDKDQEEVEDRSKASRAGLTVLELLELQARARAIRAQLQQDNINMSIEQVTHAEKNDSSDEVEIKEEPPEVVEISSEDEKPNIEDLIVKPPAPGNEMLNDRGSSESSTTVKRINNLIITVPQSKPSRKIKLKRNNVVSISISTDTVEKEKNDTNKSNESDKTLDERNDIDDEAKSEQTKGQGKARKKQKKKSKKIEKDGSDHDEITLQLSDTEKMDLLEDFNRKDYENFTSSDSKDSESSSESESGDTQSNAINNELGDQAAGKIKTNESLNNDEVTETLKMSDKITNENMDNLKETEDSHLQKNNSTDTSQCLEDISAQKQITDISKHNKNLNIDDNKKEEEIKSAIVESKGDSEYAKSSNGTIATSIVDEKINQMEIDNHETDNKKTVEEGEIVNNLEINKDLSEGELSDKNSTERDPTEKPIEIVCISDEDSKIVKKDKKREKQSKKEKRSKKSKQDFRVSNDQNFFKDSQCKEADKSNLEQQCSEEQNVNNSDNVVTIYDDDNEIIEVLELSDDSCYSDTEGNLVLSKEPTTAEIAALSAKIDEIKNEDIVTNKKETLETVEEEDDAQNISWRDRYLDSKKVKKVLTTASILNALRKKNIEIKTKLGVNKNDGENTTVNEPQVLVEGSIEQFNTLQPSTKYVNPVQEHVEESKKIEECSDKKVTKEMEKDAKLLLKMYKKLLKYNDMNRKKDHNKKKKKKQKKNKDKEKVKTSE